MLCGEVVMVTTTLTEGRARMMVSVWKKTKLGSLRMQPVVRHPAKGQCFFFFPDIL